MKTKIRTLGEQHTALDTAIAIDAHNDPSERLSGHDYDPSDGKPEKSLIQWPVGYWGKHGELREKAREVCGNPHANICVLLNGYYEVRAYTGEKFISGPQRIDRCQALEAFIAQYTANGS